MSYTMYCCSHVDTKCVEDDLYTLLHTGASYDGYESDHILCDNTGDHISEKKDIYDGLLTGMYWIWKNTKEEYVGQCTYRGYLSYDYVNPIGMQDVKRLFDKGVDFISAIWRSHVPSQKKLMEEYHQDFYYNHLHDPVVYLKRTIEMVAPAYSEAFDYAMEGSVLNYRHTFMAKREYYDAYCDWLFGILEQYEDNLRRKHYPIPPRFFGFMAERLQRAWLLESGVTLCELPVVYITERNVGV